MFPANFEKGNTGIQLGRMEPTKALLSKDIMNERVTALSLCPMQSYSTIWEGCKPLDNPQNFIIPRAINKNCKLKRSTTNVIITS